MDKNKTRVVNIDSDTEGLDLKGKVSNVVRDTLAELAKPKYDYTNTYWIQTDRGHLPIEEVTGEEFYTWLCTVWPFDKIAIQMQTIDPTSPFVAFNDRDKIVSMLNKPSERKDLLEMVIKFIGRNNIFKSKTSNKEQLELQKNN